MQKEYNFISLPSLAFLNKRNLGKSKPKETSSHPRPSKRVGHPRAPPGSVPPRPWRLKAETGFQGTLTFSFPARVCGGAVWTGGENIQEADLV